MQAQQLSLALQLKQTCTRASSAGSTAVLSIAAEAQVRKRLSAGSTAAPDAWGSRAIVAASGVMACTAIHACKCAQPLRRWRCLSPRRLAKSLTIAALSVQARQAQAEGQASQGAAQHEAQLVGQRWVAAVAEAPILSRMC